MQEPLLCLLLFLLPPPSPPPPLPTPPLSLLPLLPTFLILTVASPFSPSLLPRDMIQFGSDGRRRGGCGGRGVRRRRRPRPLRRIRRRRRRQLRRRRPKLVPDKLSPSSVAVVFVKVTLGRRPLPVRVAGAAGGSGRCCCCRRGCCGCVAAAAAAVAGVGRDGEEAYMKKRKKMTCSTSGQYSAEKRE